LITRLLLAWAVLLAATVVVSAQQKSADSGVYTASQAARGAALFESQCASCHRDGGSGPNLAGERFTRTFSDSPLSTLFNTIKTTMPRMSPGSLSDSQYTDIVAQLLRLNGYPDGMSELALGDLDAIRIPGQAPGDLEFSLVQLVGCLSQANRVWRLSNASDPVRTREPESPKDADVTGLDALPLGVRTYRLQQVYSAPAGWTGQRVVLKGFLTKAGSEERISVTSIRPLLSPCAAANP
jgi:mono/diheme cytochrome c family protein